MIKHKDSYYLGASVQIYKLNMVINTATLFWLCIYCNFKRSADMVTVKILLLLIFFHKKRICRIWLCARILKTQINPIKFRSAKFITRNLIIKKIRVKIRSKPSEAYLGQYKTSEEEFFWLKLKFNVKVKDFN